MKRVSRVRVDFDDTNYKGKRGTFADIVVKTNSTGLTMDEARQQHDDAVDGIVSAARTMRYAGTAPMRCVSISN